MFSVQFDSVELGKTNNWLKFKAYVPHISRNIRYTFDYCGTELHDSALTDEQRETVRKEMQKIFGNPPFDKRITEIEKKVEAGASVNFQ